MPRPSNPYPPANIAQPFCYLLPPLLLLLLRLPRKTSTYHFVVVIERQKGSSLFPRARTHTQREAPILFPISANKSSLSSPPFSPRSSLVQKKCFQFLCLFQTAAGEPLSEALMEEKKEEKTPARLRPSAGGTTTA